MMRTSVLRWPVRVPFPSCFSSSRRGCWDRLSRSKQTAAMARAICGAESFESQVFSGDRGGNLARCRSWRWAGGGRKLATGALSGRIWRELQKGAAPAGQRIEKASANWESFTELGRFIAMSAYRGGMSEAGFTGMLDSTAVPMIFACWAARFVAARWTGRALRTGALRQKPAGRAGLGFLPSTAREFAKRRAEQDGKTQRGRGFWGRGTLPAHWPSCCWRRRRRSWGRRRRVGGIGRTAFKKQQLAAETF